MLEPCRGVRHSPAKGVCQRAPEPCRGGAPEGVCRRGAAVGNRRMPWEAFYLGGGVRRRGVQ